MVNDCELLEMAAKAAGIPLKADFAERYDHYMADPLMWNPLVNDGDAFRLAVILTMDVDIYYGEVASGEEGDRLQTLISITGDKFDATRRAIVVAAAKLAEGK